MPKLIAGTELSDTQVGCLRVFLVAFGIIAFAAGFGSCAFVMW